ncbi:hypothetical protein G5B39_13540 (plasmid) [Rhodobacteraceae bacterium SC52]|nr:hypothetical protein G5B39_13540 [Rhodobacteraceae bacterium SC52]
MKTTQTGAIGPISKTYPTDEASAQDCVNWFWADFFPAWTTRAIDPAGLGYFDLMDGNGVPQAERKTVLAQARLLFTFSHLALLSGDPAHKAAAEVARTALSAFRKPSGLYCRALARDGAPLEEKDAQLATSYDQCFVILGLSTWGKLSPSVETAAELEHCWKAIMNLLVDPVTGLLLEHDGLDEPAAASAPRRAQNPHMHLYEAALQAFEVTGDGHWMERAKSIRAKGLEYFFDVETGTVAEFIAPDLSELRDYEGSRREIGHQCEWAWLLTREVDLGGDPEMQSVAARLLDFADRHGFAADGAMQGAAFDAVSTDLKRNETTFLLWPQTEAIKTYAIRSNEEDNGVKAEALTRLIFQRYFAGCPAFVNQLDADGQVIWADGLSRLHYHLVLALTEGARAGLWANPTSRS